MLCFLSLSVVSCYSYGSDADKKVKFNSHISFFSQLKKCVCKHNKQTENFNIGIRNLNCGSNFFSQEKNHKEFFV